MLTDLISVGQGMSNVILELTRIVQSVAMLVEAPDQVQLIVDSICEVMDGDACSLFRVNDNNEMVLLASRGFTVANNLTLPADKGLVSLVARSRHAINIANAASHPDYFPVAGSEEERYHSFCGVPLVRFGEVIGVLIVHRVQAQQLSDEYEALLITLAAQLALIATDIPLQGAAQPTTNQRITGTKGAAGIAIGAAHLCDSGELNKVADAVCEDVNLAIAQWHNLLAAVRAEICAERQALGTKITSSVGAIFDAYRMLLSDRALIGKVESEIRAGHWLPGALRLSIHHFAEQFRAMEEPYLKARAEDIQHLGNKLFNTWRGVNLQDQAQNLPAGAVVLIGAHVSVSDIAAIAPDQLAGVVCFEGSSLSHTAVVANAIGVPAVMGVGELKGLQAAELLIIDGTEGQIILRPDAVVLAEFKHLVSQQNLLFGHLDDLHDKPAVTTDGEPVRLLVNTGLLADISPGLKSGAQGIGLYRTEIPFMVRSSFPTEEEQVQEYQKVFAAYHGKPIYLRTLDIGGDKQLPYFPIDSEPNPALGWRGIRFSLDNIQILMTQVRAMIRAAAGANNLHILLPMISSTNEIDTFSLLLSDACAQLSEEGVSFCRPKTGVMVEVPAAISQLPFWAEKIDFVSIGSNDLSQYLLALDRNNSRVAARYDHVHPAVLHEIYRTVNTARQYDLPLSLCGEMASDPAAVVLLLGMGIRTLSMSAAKLPRIKWLIRSLSIARAEALLAEALSVDNVGAIRALVNAALQDMGLEELVY